MAGRKRAGSRPARGADAGVGTEFAEREGFEEDPDAKIIAEVERAVNRAADGTEASARSRKEAKARFPCPLCQRAFHHPSDVQSHLATYGNPGFGAGDEVRCRKRSDLVGKVQAMAWDHATFEMFGGRYLVKAFERSAKAAGRARAG